MTTITEQTYTIAPSDLPDLVPVKALAEIVKMAGWDISSDNWRSQVEGKITLEMLFEYGRYSWEHKKQNWKGIKIWFTHAADGYKKQHRTVNAKDNTIDIAKLKAKIQEMLDLYAQYDDRYAQQRAKADERNAKAAELEKRVADLGLRTYYRDLDVKIQVSDRGVNLECKDLTPELAQKVLELIKAEGGKA